MASVWPLYQGLISGVLQRLLSFWKVLPSPRGTLERCQSDQQVLGHFPDQRPSPADCLVCPRHNPVLELYGQFLRPHGLVFALTCTVNCGTLYRHLCAFPNHVQSIEFTTGVLQSSCRNISRMINGNSMHLSSISNVIEIGILILMLIRYVCFLFVLIHLKNSPKTVFALSLWGIVCRLIVLKKNIEYILG